MFVEGPPTAKSMVPVSDNVLKERLISVPTASERPPSSRYPGFTKLTVYRFCETGNEKVILMKSESKTPENRKGRGLEK